MQAQFEIVAGSVTGTQHQRVGKNNQDAYYSLLSEQAAIAVVCDGCGSGQHSEVGAKIGARLVVETLWRAISSPTPHPPLLNWETVQQDLLTQLQALIQAMGENWQQTVSNYFLFTIVGAIITPSDVSIFSLGDGLILLNGQLISIGPFPGNAPPYLAYNLLNPKSNQWQFQLHKQMNIDEAESIIIGTDGVNDLIAATGRTLPGKNIPIPPIHQFLEDRYFQNPDLLRRQLTLMNREVTKPNWQEHHLIKETGLLPDDTALIIIRKQSNSKIKNPA